MRTIISAVLLLLSATALATNPPPKDPSAEANATAAAVGIGVGVGIAGVKNDVTNTSVNGQHQGQSLDNDIKNTNVNDLSNHNGQGQHQGQDQSQSASSDQEQSQSANNEGNSQTTNITSNYKGVRNAPSVALGSVYPTAGCQGGFGIGGSGVNGSGLLNFSFTKKECETVVLAQNFAALGMPETSCDILKTTKAWKRAVKANPQIAAVCDPQPTATADLAVPPPPMDTSQFVKRDELEERDRRMIQKLTNK